jgi:hypothetical protein
MRTPRPARILESGARAAAGKAVEQLTILLVTRCEHVH